MHTFVQVNLSLAQLEFKLKCHSIPVDIMTSALVLLCKMRRMFFYTIVCVLSDIMDYKLAGDDQPQTIQSNR